MTSIGFEYIASSHEYLVDNDHNNFYNFVVVVKCRIEAFDCSVRLWMVRTGFYMLTP